MNIAELGQREIDEYGEHVSIIFEGRQYTNVDMLKAANRLGNALKGLGVERGDRVIIQMPNCPEVLQSFGAVYAIGAIVVPINFLVGDEETAYIYQDTGAETIISSMAFYDKIQNCRKGAPAIKNIILIDEEGPEGTLSYHKLLQENTDQLELVDTSDDEVAALIYTSGTTGKPKGVMHTHGSLLANAHMQHQTIKLPDGMTSIMVLPLCHSYGIASMNYGALRGSGRFVVLGSFDIDAVFQAIDKYKANMMGAVPTMYLYMLLHPEPEKYDFSSMKYWISGSAPLALDTWQAFKDKFGFEIVEGWGLTEAGANNSVNPLDGKKKIGSIGLPMEGLTMGVMDDDGALLPEHKEGEIVLSGPVLMKGYWNKPEETSACIIDGWLHTGDVGYRDEEGYYFITDRKKDLIIKGGENLSPREIEEVIFSHPAISEAAVIGIPDKVYGEEIKAFVVPNPGQQVTEQELIDYCRQRLKRFKSPKMVQFMDALPKSLVGKILKKELRKAD